MSDGEDEDLKKAIALSLADQTSDSSEHDGGQNALPQPSQAFKPPLGIAGLDRKTMEAERLKRLQARQGDQINRSCEKRSRPITPPSLARPAKLARIEHPEPSTSLKNATSALSFPHGKLFKTWALGQPRSSDIKIEEVLERSTLQTALLSSFQYDLEWLFTKFDTSNTRFHFVVHEPKDGGPRNSLVSDLESLGANVKAYAPSEGRCMHSKLMLLVHPTKLRVVVPSANLVPYDWGESGIMENTVWVIDLPRRADDSDPVSTPFLDELKHFLSKQRVPLSVITGLNKFDWSATRPLAFVHTVAGHSYGSDMARTGLTGLSTAVRQLGLTVDAKTAKVDMCASSVGSLTDSQLSNLHAAARGDFHVPIPASGKPTTLPQPAATDLTSSFRLYYPTYDYIAASPRGGVANGGTIWFNRKYYERSNFPKSVFREYQSTRGHLLSHCKMLFVRGVSSPPAPAVSNTFDRAAKTPSTADAAAEKVAYVYAGSANCSKSAWGTVTIDRTTGSGHRNEAKIFCDNWECGVLIPVQGPGVAESLITAKHKEGHRLQENKESAVVVIDDDEEEVLLSEAGPHDVQNQKQAQSSREGSKGKLDSNITAAPSPVSIPEWDVFRSVINGPFKYPAQEYAGTEPWYVLEHHPAYQRGQG